MSDSPSKTPDPVAPPPVAGVPGSTAGEATGLSDSDGRPLRFGRYLVEALGAARAALALDPKLVLDPRQVSPKVRAVYARARGRR